MTTTTLFVWCPSSQVQLKDIGNTRNNSLHFCQHNTLLVHLLLTLLSQLFQLVHYCNIKLDWSDFHRVALIFILPKCVVGVGMLTEGEHSCTNMHQCAVMRCTDPYNGSVVPPVIWCSLVSIGLLSDALCTRVQRFTGVHTCVTNVHWRGVRTHTSVEWFLN